MGLTVAEEIEAGGVRVRVAPVDVGAHRHALIARADAGPKDVWVTVGIVATENVVREVRELLEVALDSEDQEATMAEVVHQAAGIYGVPWRDLTSRTAAVQHALYESCPDWFEEVPSEQVWALRRWVRAAALDRVAAALVLCRGAYCSDYARRP